MLLLPLPLPPLLLVGRARARERRGAHGNGGMRRERILSLPLFFVAVTGPQKQERVVHLQVAAVSSFIGWLWM